MEFPFDVDKILDGRIVIIENKDCNGDLRIYSLDQQENSQKSSWIYHSSANTPWDLKLKKRKEELALLLDEIGYASARAQNLPSPVTSFKKLLNSSQQKIYIIRDINEPRCVIGMLKIGIKRLFVSDDIGAYHEVDPLCVLDFYIHESKQRCGFGHELFDAMLETENISPEKLAIDRPSFKCLQFLQKHYGLNQPIPQNNNFVIFSGFLHGRPVTRPPIFLYSGKVLQNSACSFTKPQVNQPDSVKNEIKVFDSVQVPVSIKDIKKNKTFYSSAGNCLQWDDAEENKTSYLNLKPETVNNSFKHENDRSKKGKNWGVYDAMHSYSSGDNECDDWNARQSTNCYLKWDNAEENKTSYRKLKPEAVTDSFRHENDRCKEGKNWGVHDAMHSYSSDDNECDDWNAGHSTNCSLTPVDSIMKCSQRKWDELQSSWNILGVTPANYSLFQKQS